MIKALPAVAATLVAWSAGVAATPGNTPGMHKIVTTSEIAWKQGPESLPPGGQFAVLYGDPSKEGMFTMRLRVPKGYSIPPHTHPRPEIVTVISGVARLGMGAKLDAAKARPLAAGSFFSLEPGTPHFVVFDEDTVVQVNSAGPWAINYLNPSDDPRRKKP